MSVLALVRRLISLLLVMILGIAGVLALVRPWLLAAAPALYEGLAPPLQGVVNITPPAPPGLANILAGRTQAAANAAFNTAIPQRAMVVRAFNDLLWWGAGSSYMADKVLLTGRGRELINSNYLSFYCGYIARPDPEAVAATARRLRRVQDWLDARGTPFAYLLAPSKAAFTHASFETQFPCKVGGDESAYAADVATLRAAGVRVVAGRQVLRANPAPIPFYPRSGIHWNELGAALITRELVATLRRAGAPLPDFRFETEMLPTEQGYDVDLLSLMNLGHEPPLQPAPKAIPAVHGGPPLSLADVSDSYMTSVDELLLRAHVFRHIDTFFYLILARRSWEPALESHDLDQESPAAFDPLVKADVIVLEEVDYRVGGPFVDYFLTLMEHAMKNAGEGLPPKSFSGARGPA
jgi:alginate O-acetyltransferase complex protein AlgJ